MERVFGTNHPDPGEVEKAKKALKVKDWKVIAHLIFNGGYVSFFK